MWSLDKRHGQGTYWRMEGKKLRREYTGDWFEDKKHGRGTFFYKNGDRYDGYWVSGMPQGEGRMIYANENIYAPEDFATSLYTKMGIDPTTVMHDTNNRPIQLVNNGRLIKELFA